MEWIVNAKSMNLKENTMNTCYEVGGCIPLICASRVMPCPIFGMTICPVLGKMLN